MANLSPDQFVDWLKQTNIKQTQANTKELLIFSRGLVARLQHVRDKDNKITGYKLLLHPDIEHNKLHSQDHPFVEHDFDVDGGSTIRAKLLEAIHTNTGVTITANKSS